MATTPKPASTGKDGVKPADTPEFRVEQEKAHDRYPTPQDDAAATGQVGFGHGDINPVTATNAQLERADVSDREAKAIAELPPRKLYNPNTGLRPRVGGPYLDQVELERSERQRAVIEGREPDYTNMAGTQGVPLMTAGQVANLHGGNPALADFIDANADNPKLGPTPVTEANMVGENLEVIRTAEAEKQARQEWDNTRVTSHDQPGVVFSDPAAGEKMPSAKATTDNKTKTEK